MSCSIFSYELISTYFWLKIRIFIFLYFQVFDNRLQCNTQCKRKKEGSDEKRECEEKFCKDVDYEKKDKDDNEDDSTKTEIKKKENLKQKKKDEAEDSFEAEIEKEEEIEKEIELENL